MKREERERLVAPWARSRFGVFHDDGRFEELTDAEAETHALGGRARCVGGAHDAQLVRCALLDAAREVEELREWQRRAAAELRVTAQGFTANRALVRELLARVKP